jgi:hypothetical protein
MVDDCTIKATGNPPYSAVFVKSGAAPKAPVGPVLVNENCAGGYRSIS